MISPTEIHSPKNWQDFEMLCLKLWGEIWNIPHEIELNSDNSQGQDGVDIYGIPSGEDGYFGIQCKNKKLHLIDGAKNRLTISDIQAEIEKALHFKPKLKKLIIATSLMKDKKVEEFVRITNLEHLQNGLFSLQICFWDFFQRKIIEFQTVADWYLKNEGFYRNNKLTLGFEDGQKKTFFPKFQKTVTKCVVPAENWHKPVKADLLDLSIESSNGLNVLAHWGTAWGSHIDWHQYCWFKLYIKNEGATVIENFKIELEFEGEFEKIGVTSPSFLRRDTFIRNTYSYSNCNTSLLIEPNDKVLVQNDGFYSNSIYICPIKDKNSVVTIKWNLIAKNYSDSGQVQAFFEPKYHVVNNEVYVQGEDISRIEESFSLVKRRGMLDLGGPKYFDKESDFTFE